MKGVIWSKTQKTFVPISSVPTYAMMQQERFRQSRALEIHNFQLQNFTLTSFQEPHFLHFYNNNTKVTGLCGEIWNLLSESLNFTLQPVKANVNSLGMPEKDRSFKNGLLGIIFCNETMAIPKLETFTSRLVATEFSVPFWTNRIQLYIHPEVVYDDEWMIKIFSWKIWCTILIMCILLSLCTFLTQSILIQKKNKRKNVSFSEHIFYNFGNLCNQGYIPEYLNGKSRILEVSLGLFCSMICTSFGAVLFIFLSKSGFVPPFDKFESLVYNTKFSVVTLKDSIGEILFKILTTDSIVRAKKSNRLIVVSTIQEMHEKICSLPKKYAMFQNEETHKVNGEIKCHLINIGEEFTRSWVTSGIVRNFKYKRTIDVGILKLIEVGLLSALKDRWMENKFKQCEDDQKLKPIELHQVSLIIAMMCCGAIMALVIFIIEKIVFTYKVRCIYRSYPKLTVTYFGYIIISSSFKTMNGVIWNKTQKTFVPISNVPMYAMMQKERLRQSRALELHNFQLQNLTLASFQEQYLVHFYDNNMKITGFCGEIWNLLSESLNFTLQLVKANLDDQGMPQKDALSFKNGLLSIIFRNETIAIAKLQSFSPELTVTEFSIPFWTNRIQLYIHRETIYDNIWMVNIFSWKIWCVILSMCLLLSLCTFLTQSILIQNKDKRKNISLSEHLFYNFGNLCNQGYIPLYLDGKSRILEVSLGLFCSIIYMSFGAVLFIHLSKSVFVPPFDSFTTLVTNTKYNVIGLKGSTAEAIFKINEDPFLQAKKTERLKLTSTFEDMHKIACFSKKEKYVIFQTEAMYKVTGNIMCHLTNVGEPYAKTWIASGIVKNFKYKRSIDLGILKLMEIGLLNVLKKRWLENDLKYYAEDETPKPIELHQVSLIIAVMCCGTIIALIIFIIEKIVFAYKLR